MLGWLHRLLPRPQKPEQDGYLPEVPPPPGEAEPSFQPAELTTAFYVIRRQVEARYRIEIDYLTFRAWHKMIADGDDAAVNLGRRDNGSYLYVVSHHGTDIFLIWHDGRMTTAVENVGGRYNSLVRQRRLAREKPMTTPLSAITDAPLLSILRRRRKSRREN